MKPPITIDDHGDISIYETVQAAERDVEPIEATRHDFLAYGSEGQLLRGPTPKTGVFGLGLRVKLEPAEDNPTHALVLRQRLIGFLVTLGEPRDQLEKASLADLLARGLRLLTTPRTKA